MIQDGYATYNDQKFYNSDLQNSVILASSNSVIGNGDQQQLLNSTFDFTPGGTGVNYPGLNDSTIASMPIEDLYKRIDKQMNKTNSFFDLRLSQAIKKSQGDLKESTALNVHDEQHLQFQHQPSGAPIVTFDKIKNRFLRQTVNSKSAGRVRSTNYSSTNGNYYYKANLLQKISNDFEAYTSRQ